jgi:aminoglycoside phosphotransferase (APT) family kinase protein
MHAEQLVVTTATVRRLVREQFPSWRALPVRAVHGPGTVNAIFRVGDVYAARFPLQPEDPEGVRSRLAAEAEAARELHEATRVPTPRPVALGEPGAGYPLPWSVQTWLPGTTADDVDVSGSEVLARDLAALIRELRAVPTRGRRFTGDNRGGDLRRHDAWVETCLARSEGLLDVGRLRRLWARWRELPRIAPDVMSHGDLVPGNVLVAGGRLAGLLDTGGFGPADPALDLVAAWHLLDVAPRQLLRHELDSGDVEWRRGMAWALEQALGLVWYYDATNPAMASLGRRTLTRLLEATSAT